MNITPRDAGRIVRAAVDKAANEIQQTERHPATVVEFAPGNDATVPRARIHFDDAPIDHTIEAQVHIQDVKPGDRVWAEFPPPQGVSVTGKADAAAFREEEINKPGICFASESVEWTPENGSVRVIELFCRAGKAPTVDCLLEVLLDGVVKSQPTDIIPANTKEATIQLSFEVTHRVNWVIVRLPTDSDAENLATFLRYR